jgi:hypothetical protein
MNKIDGSFVPQKTWHTAIFNRLVYSFWGLLKRKAL